MSKQSKGLVKKIVCFACAVILIAVAIVVPIVLNMFDSMLSIIFGAKELDSATRAAGETLATQIEEEGIVMVKNDENCLPLQESDVKKDSEYRVNVFGWASIDWLMGGSGSGRSVNPDQNLKPDTTLLSALNDYKVFSDDGIKYNTELTDFYKQYQSARAPASTNTLNSHDNESCVLYEPAISTYSDTLKQNAIQYSDVALVVLGRITGESTDAPKVQYKYNASTDSERTYLDVSTEEEDLLEYVGKTFSKVIVIINSTNTMNLEFMDRIDGLDSCLIVGGTGNNAANAVPNILFGKKVVETERLDDDGEPVKDSNGDVIYDTEIVNVSPSGKTVDTYAYDFKTNANWAYAAMDGTTQYTGTNPSIYPLTTTNPNVGTNDRYPGVSYLDYAEGIYVGYKWYETADTEGYWNDVDNQYGKGYEGVVQYPFGYGLTYTTFEWSVGMWKVEDGKISVTVQVTNTGDYAAQEVVELYFNPPYTKGGLEKASVNLCAFEKTPVAVKPGESIELELSFDIQDMASYDENEDDGAYVLESGDYVISLRTDAHTVVNATNATYTYKVGDKVVYNTYAGTNGVNEISNLFTGDDVSDGIAVDGSDTEDGIENVWLSRADFADTFHSEKENARAWNEKLLTNNLYTSDAANSWDEAWLANYKAEHNGKEPELTQGAERKYILYENGEFTDDGYFFGNPKNYNSSDWEELLDQLTTAEMQTLVLHGYVHEEAIASIGKPKTVSVDGPAQIGSFKQSNPGVGYPMPTVIAQTWNKELAKSFGLAVGTETLNSARDGWYAPGVNLHRSAFGGRNYEYYSEDSFLSGVMCAATVRGALNAGVYTYIKHFIGYDQESYRDGLYCWMTEQTLREIYLRPFKIAIDDGATGLMTSYGRLGSIWSGGSESLLTDLLRDEWGFKGTVLTDYSDHQDFMNGDQMLRAGGDLWMDGYKNDGKFTKSTSSTAFNARLREASKNIIYTWANAAYEAQQYAETDDSISITRASKDMFKWWWAIAIGADVVFVAGAAVLVFVALKKPKNKKKDNAAA